jgi:pimeloyl-ACP methyl ester carboxylesterase
MERRDSIRTGTFARADGGVRIRIHHLGGTGPPLMCVHATGFHGRLWEPYARLREHFSVIALDQRGHGDSDKPESGYEWTKFGDDVLAVVDELELTQPAGIGHSAGATALILAEAMRPGTFSRLVLMDPTLLPPEFRAVAGAGINPMSDQARRRRAVWESPEEMIERLRNGTPLANWREEFLRAYAVYGTKTRPDGSVELKCPPEIEALVYAAGPNDAWDRLADIRCPTLLLTGETSPLWSGDRAARAAAQLPYGRAVTMHGGHFFPMEHPDETMDVVVPFLSGEE